MRPVQRVREAALGAVSHISGQGRGFPAVGGDMQSADVIPGARTESNGLHFVWGDCDEGLPDKRMGGCNLNAV